MTIVPLVVVPLIAAVVAVAWWFRPTAGRPHLRLGRLIGASLVLGVAAGALGPIAVVAGAAAWLVIRWWRPRRTEARRRAEVAAGLPDAVDILAASLESGRAVPAALRDTARWAPTALRDALAAAVSRLDAGWRRVDVLERLSDDLGPEVRPLVSALLAADRYGVPVAEAVRRLVDDMRRRRRLDAEAAARRLPVRMTVPLVVAVLPAFALLTIVPLLLSALRGLGAGDGP